MAYDVNSSKTRIPTDEESSTNINILLVILYLIHSTRKRFAEQPNIWPIDYVVDGHASCKTELAVIFAFSSRTLHYYIVIIIIIIITYTIITYMAI